MASKIVVTNGVYDLSGIKTLKDLQEEIAFLKESINKEEDVLENHFRSMPRHFVKSTTDQLLPAFLNKLIANGSWKLLLSSVALFANPFSKGLSFKKNIVNSAKRLGLITLLKTGYNLWKKKHDEKTTPVSGLKSPGVTVLKTKNIKRG
ncbi:MAG TPA: hypothetical protein VFW07_28600 [Parafilimonas sp.]|nr:hypothetical protein [Parafilimonas sp.]